ncbi:polyketide synthase [Lecanosticta acicola]|uniref:Polyketide synthase n=1 Tax=Lecanosticta acicola TaxID=111012 RepID=A0AAI9EEE5_9PEZI|nr:polyketide synthase [Lecanosticta acicola]
MPSPAHNILLFGDQSVDKLPAIRSLCRSSSKSKVLRDFLQAANDAVQIQAAKLRPDERACFLNADSIEALAEHNAAAAAPSEVVATILMGIARLGELLLHAEQRTSILGSPLHPVDILAFCTGEIPAAVALTAQDTSQLFELAVETVAIIFRLALAIIRRSEAIDTTQECWATTLVGLPRSEVEKLLQTFFETEHIPLSRRISISVEGKGWLTLFGPPSTLGKLWTAVPQLRDCAKLPTDAKGAVHMSNLPGLNIDQVLESSPLLESPVDHAKARMLSPFTRQAYEGATFGETLREIIPDITQNAYYPESTTASVIQSLRSSSPNAAALLTVMGHTHYQPLVQKALEDANVKWELAQHDESKGNAATRSGSGLVAVVGMSGRFPDAENVKEYFDNLLRGQVSIKEIPKSRFDLDQFYDAAHQKKNSTAAKHGTFLDRPGAFDYRLFNMSPREAAQTDPLQRLYLTVAHEALEMSGYHPDSTPSTFRNRVATYFGQCSDDHRDGVPNSESGTDVYWTPGTVRAFAPSRLNYHFKFGGGSYSVDNACASSTTCVSLACSALLDRECDMALAGGGSILSSPHPFAALSRAGMVSLTGGCRTFHDDADGYCRGEGLGCVVLKRLEDAEAENDNILGVICGSGRNYSNTAPSMTHPSSEAQQRLYRRVLQKANMRPEEISFVEMHGTGTQAGDAVEVSSVLQVFADKRAKDSPLIVGAVKANIGHGEAAAGICSLIKSLQMLRTGRVPPQPGMPFKINHRFPDLAKKNVYIASKGASIRPSKRSTNGRKKIMINSFDASGGNTCLAIEEASPPAARAEDSRTCHVIAVSARTESSFVNNKKRLLEFVKCNPSLKLSDLAYSTTARRMHHTLRTSYVASSTKELLQVMESDLKINDQDIDSVPRKSAPAGVIFVFTGQGSQYVGMGRALFHSQPEFRQLLEQYQAMLAAQGLPTEKVHFLELISRDDLDLATQSAAKVQLAVVALEIALASLWKSFGVIPDLVIGHSLGEYAALCVAGVLSVSDALYLVASRAIMMEDQLIAGTYAMLVIRQNAEIVRKQLAQVGASSCQIALKNAPEMTVVSGTKKDVEELRAHLQAQSMKTMLLQLPYGFHSAQLDPILEGFETIAGSVAFSKPTIPVASSLLAKVVREAGTFSPRYLRDQARQAVDYIGALKTAQSAGLIKEKSVFLEIGPQPICSSFIGSTLSVEPTRLLAALRNGEDAWKTTSSALSAAYNAGLPVNWPEYHKAFANSLTLLDLPTYAFEETNFWTPFTSPETAVTSPLVIEPSAATLARTLKGPLQRLLSCDVGNDSVSMAFESNTSETDLREAILGHIVADTPLMPVTLWCSMGTAAGQHAYEKLYGGARVPGLELRNVTLTSSVTVNEDCATVVVITAYLDKRSQKCKVTFESRCAGILKQHGGCEVVFCNDDEQRTTILPRFIPLIKSRIKALQAGSGMGKVHRLLRPVVYRLFQHLVTYSERYQAIDELVLDPEARDAVAKLTLNSSSESTDLLPAYWNDSIAHLAAIVLNCGLAFPEDKAFLTSGFESWVTIGKLCAGVQYTSYVTFQEIENDTTIVGHVYVLEQDRLVATVTGLKFHMLKKSALKTLLSATRSATSVSSPVDARTHQSIPSLPREALNRHDAATVSISTTTRQIAAGQTTALKPDIASVFLAVVAAETGLGRSELLPSTEFADIGVDSLMSITVLAALKRQTGIELMGNFLVNNPTIGAATKALKTMFATESEPIPDPIQRPRITHTPSFTAWPSTPSSELSDIAPAVVPGAMTTPGSTSSDIWVAVTPMSEYSAPPSPPPAKSLPLDQVSTTPTCKVVHIQGKASNQETPLFLLADETGTITSYIQLPQLGNGRNVYGVESPFVKEPSQFNCSFADLARICAAAVRKQRPSGPYQLGGFSIGGGLLAYEVAHILRAAGEPVEALYLVNTPLINTSDEMIPTTVAELQDSGIINGSKRSGKFHSTVLPAQQDHTARVFTALADYPIKNEILETTATIMVAKRGLRSSVSPTKRLSQMWSAERMQQWCTRVAKADIHQLDADHHGMMSYPKTTDMRFAVCIADLFFSAARSRAICFSHSSA